MTTPERSVSEIVKELMHRIYEYEDTRGNVEIKLTQAIQAERQKREESDNTYKVLLQYIESDKVDLAKRTLQGLLTQPNHPK
jgi:hypothetical protein